MNRAIKRHVAQQQFKIGQELNNLVRNFTKYVGDDLPRPELRGNLLTNRFNQIWIEFCKHWERTNKRALVEPNPKAFLHTVCGMEYMEEQQELAQTTTTTGHAHAHQNAHNENEQNGPGQAEKGTKKTRKKASPGKG